MSRSMQIAAAVAAALGASSAVLAAPPALSTAAAAPNVLYVAGSSAAKNGIIAALQTNLCGGATNALTLSSSSTGNTNFFAVSCTVASTGPSSLVGQVATVYYRDEGGSVVGALPIVSGKSIYTLNLNDTTNIPSCASGATACAPNVSGSSALNGTADSFGGAVIKKAVQLGITDLEPTVFVNDNYPSGYQTSVYGTASATQLGSLNTSPLFQQVFGLFVNVSGGLFGSPQPTSINVPKAVLTNILQGFVTDWSTASNTSGNALTTASEAITVVNREAGSGSRAGASIYFTGYECVASTTDIADPAGATGDFFSTGNVLAQANKVAGSITYASIDNFNTSSFPNLALVAIDGIVPTNLNAAAGQYDYWFESTAVTASGLSTSSAALASWLIGELQTEATAPHLIDVNAIPGQSTNNPALPVSGTASTLTSGGTPIYVSQFTRSGASCNLPADAL